MFLGKPPTFAGGFLFLPMNPNKAVILINTGSPDSPDVNDVRTYLREFLGDPYVINMPWLLRKLLVNGIIAPIRGPRSAKLYRKIWTNQGSPLIVNSFKFADKLASRLEHDYHVYVAMRYGNPSLENCISDISKKDYRQVIAIPLYPQYADSTTGTILAETNRLIKKYRISADIINLDPFFSTSAFINAFGEKIIRSKPSAFDHMIFSFHGLPVKQTERMHPGKTCLEANCRNEYNDLNRNCYYASCYATARLLAGATGLNNNDYTVSFQSRLGMNWLKPYTDTILQQKASEGAKKVLICSPSFVADCLETIHELGIEYKELFMQYGGEELTLIESLNDDPLWVEGMERLIRNLPQSAL